MQHAQYLLKTISIPVAHLCRTLHHFYWIKSNLCVDPLVRFLEELRSHLFNAFERWFFLARILLLATVASHFLPESSFAAGEQDGFSVFVDSLKKSGLNPQTISSGALSFSVVVEPIPQTDAEFRVGVKDYVERQRQLLNQTKEKRIRNQILETIEESETWYSRERKAALMHEKHRMLFIGIEPYNYVKDEVTFPSDPTRPSVFSVGNNGGEKQESFYLKRDGERNVYDLFPRDHCHPVNRYGRMQGEPAVMTAGFLAFGSRQKSIGQFEFEFNPETVEQWSEVNKQLVVDAESGVRILREEPYKLSNTSSANAFVVQKGATVGPKGLAMPKLIAWIDPSHGSICPRLEIYVNEQLSILHESNSFFLEDASGLYWPTVHRESRFDSQTGKIKYVRVTTFQPSEVDLNIPIGLENFQISLREGDLVEERRNRLGQGFVARSAIEFIPKAGKFELKVGDQFELLKTIKSAANQDGPALRRGASLFFLGIGFFVLLSVLILGVRFFGRKG